MAQKLSAGRWWRLQTLFSGANFQVRFRAGFLLRDYEYRIHGEGLAPTQHLSEDLLEYIPAIQELIKQAIPLPLTRGCSYTSYDVATRLPTLFVWLRMAGDGQEMVKKWEDDPV